VLKLEMKQLSGAFRGQDLDDLSTIDGTWTQLGNSLPLVLKRVKDAAELERPRPQNPVKPYPYREEEVAYSNPSVGFQLGATLTIPPGKGPFSRRSVDHRFGTTRPRRKPDGASSVSGARRPSDA